MTVDKQVAGLLKRYLDYEYDSAIEVDVFKQLVSKLNLFPLSLIKITNMIEKDGYAVVYEPVLVYSKEQQHARLTMSPKSGEQVITKLSFDPTLYKSVLAGCELKGFLTSGHVVAITHGTYTAYSNFLFIAKDEEVLKYVKNKYKQL